MSDEPTKPYVIIPHERLNAIASALHIYAEHVKSLRTGPQVADMIQELHIVINALATVAYNFQKKQIQAMQFDYDPTESGLRSKKPVRGVLSHDDANGNEDALPSPDILEHGERPRRASNGL